MDDVKELIEDLKRINEKAAKMSEEALKIDVKLLAFEIDFFRGDLLKIIDSLEKRKDRLQRISRTK